MADLPFTREGPAEPASPVVISVPHAGRDYPAALRAALRVPAAALASLEDRHVDLVGLAARRTETIFIQRRPRAWIDLNRSEAERDPRIDEGARAVALPAPSAKLRSGLGLVPRRTAAAGDLWRQRFTADDIAARIERDYRPYHDGVAAALASARARFGTAVLLDLHSMPPLPAGGARAVIGDRFGRTAAARFVARVEVEARAAGWRPARNTPYAGGHVVERHAAPLAGIHAIQLELDRSLYLEPSLDAPGPGLDGVAAAVRRILDVLAEEALAMPGLLAAE